MVLSSLEKFLLSGLRHPRGPARDGEPQGSAVEVQRESVGMTVGRVLGLCGLVSLGLGGVIIAGGVTYLESALVALVTFPQILFGALLWGLIFQHRNATEMECVAAGSVLGPAVGALFFACAQSVMVGRHVGIFVVGVEAVVSALMLWWFVRRPRAAMRVGQSSWAASGVVVVALVGALALTYPMWRSLLLPSQVTETGTLGGDSAFHEAVANTIGSDGFRGNLMVSGESMRYHWLGHAWSALERHLAGLEPYVSTTRVAPVLAIVAALLISYVTIRRLSGSQLVAWVAVAFVMLLESPFGSGVLVPQSLPQLWATPLIMAFGLGLITASARITLVELVGLSALTFFATLSKVNSIILIVGILLATSHMVRMRPRRWIVVVSVLVTSCLLPIPLFESGYGNSLWISFSSTIEAFELLPLVPQGRWLVLAVAIAAVVLAAPFISLVNLLPPQSVQVWRALGLALGTGFAGILAALTTTQWGHSQTYFVTTSLALLVPITAWGWMEAWSSIRGVRVSGLPVGILVGASALASLAVVRSVQGATTTVIAVLGFSAVLVVLGVLAGWAPRVTVAAATIPTAIIGVGGVNVLPHPTSDVALTINSSNSISRDQIQMLIDFSKMPDSPGIVASNFVCDNPWQSPPECLSIQYPISAVARRQALLEGYSYSLGNGPLPDWASIRLRKSTEFADSPSRASLEYLWGEGVRWMFVDHRRTSTGNWEPWASTELESENASMLRLTNPSCLIGDQIRSDLCSG